LISSQTIAKDLQKVLKQSLNCDVADFLAGIKMIDWLVSNRCFNKIQTWRTRSVPPLTLAKICMILKMEKVYWL
jgi:hypothetical protein